MTDKGGKENVTEEDMVRVGRALVEKKMAKKLGDLATVDDILGISRDEHGELLPVRVPIKRVTDLGEEVPYVEMRPASIGVLNRVFGVNMLTGGKVSAQFKDDPETVKKMVAELFDHLVKPKMNVAEFEGAATMQGFTNLIDMFMNWLEASGLSLEYSPKDATIGGGVSPN